jgi:uncharacterized protein YcbK (DUF882 family)
MSCNTFNSPTSKFSDVALTTDQLRANLYSFNSLIDIQNDPVKRYDVVSVALAINGTYTLFSNLTNKSDYEYLSDRITRGVIPPSEYADFLDQSKISLIDINAMMNGLLVGLQPANYFSQLDQYYNKNFANSQTGGFCSLFNGAVMKLLSLVSGAASLLTQLKNGLASIIGQLMSLKELLTNLVDKLKDMMIKQIENIVKQAMGAVSKVIGAATFFMNKAKQVQAFFSDANMDSLKGKIEEIMSQMAGGYEKLTPEVIAYLLFRMCQLSEVVTNFMKSPVDTLNSLISNYAQQELVLTNVSREATIRAVQAGGYRMDPSEVIRLRAEAASKINSDCSGGEGSVDPASYITMGFTQDEIQMAMDLTAAGNKHLKFQSQVTNQNDPVEGAGYKYVKPEVWMRIFRISKRMGLPLTCNSGYRSPAYNAAQPGSAKSSLHMSGMAVDISMGNIPKSRIPEYIKYASQEGFVGMEYYGSSNFVHTDIGSRRRWYPGNGSLPNAVEDALQIHIKDGFRRGRPADPIQPTTPETPATPRFGLQ